MLGIEYSKAFDAGREDLIDSMIEKRPTGYQDLLERTIRVVSEHFVGDDDWSDCNLDPDRIKCIDWGHYQGTLFFVIGCTGYQPDEFYTARVSYGSCSHCDAFQACDDGIDRWDDEGNERPLNRDDCAGYVRLCLHLFQSLRPAQ